MWHWHLCLKIPSSKLNVRLTIKDNQIQSEQTWKPKRESNKNNKQKHKNETKSRRSAIKYLRANRLNHHLGQQRNHIGQWCILGELEPLEKEEQLKLFFLLRICIRFYKINIIMRQFQDSPAHHVSRRGPHLKKKSA